jgi:hypothetical protein
MDGTAVIVFGVMVYGIVFGALSSTVASKKGHSSGAWFWCGFFFGIFGLIAAAGLPTKSADSDRGSAFTKICPRCAESVKAAAAVCRYCGHEFEIRESVETRTPQNRARTARDYVDVKPMSMNKRSLLIGGIFLGLVALEGLYLLLR